MTLIIAADAQDHLILAADHCAVLSRASNRDEPEVVLDNYRKLYPWKYGALAGSGDVFLMAAFHRLFLAHGSRNQPIDLLQIALEAKAIRSSSGIDASRSTGNLFFTLPAPEGFHLHGLYIEENTIELELIEPISGRFSMGEVTSDESACHALSGRLRPSFFFESRDAFQRHHLDLLTAFFARQSMVDELVTASFDMLILEKKTGTGLFWQVSDCTKPFATIDLQTHPAHRPDALAPHPSAIGTAP